MKPRVVIIGNSQIDNDYARLVDSSELVIRCNYRGSMNRGLTGTRTDILCINYLVMNDRRLDMEGVARVWVVEPYDSAVGIIVKRAKHVLYRVAGLRYFRGLRKRSKYRQFAILHPQVDIAVLDGYKQCRAKIRQGAMDLREPSTGFMVLEHCLAMGLAHTFEIVLLGFSWQGLPCHHWQREREIARAYEQQGLITILDNE
jgi:hypothetical protein